MTAVPQSQPPPMGDAAQSVAVPSLMARSRQSASVRAPTRERVSEAIALVRARQTSVAKEYVPKVRDISELKNLRSTGGIKISTSSGSSKKSNPPFTSTSTEVMRSPLTPAGQTGFPEKSFQHRPKHAAAKPNSFFQNVFASRSDVANTSQPEEQSLPNQPSSHDEPEENLPGSTNSSGFVNPLELVKREFQLATQSASRGRKATKSKKKSKAKSTTASASITSTTLSAQSSTVASAPSLGQDGSNDSDEAPVDAKTISDVAKFLDALKISELDNANSPMEQVGSADSDPIEAMRQNESDDFIYGGSDDDDDDDDLSEDSSTGSVNLETLAEIGAFIDAVSKAGSSTASSSTSTSTSTSTSMSLPLKFDAQSEAEIGAFIDALHPDTTSAVEDNTIETQSLCTAPETDVYDTFDTVHETTTPGNTQQNDVYKTKQDAPTFSDPNIADTDVRMNVANESVAKKRVTIVEPFKEEIAFEELELLQVTSSGSCEIKAQTRVSQPSPIYEQVEAKSLRQGARKDPPAVLTARNAFQSDPPPDNMLNEAIMQMHEAQTVAPSYSAESLESGNLTVDRPMVEEKKFVDGELLQEASLSKDGTIEGLAHRAEANSAKEETNTVIGGVQGGAPESGELPKQDESEESSMLGQDSQDYDEILSEALGRSEENEIHLLNDNLPSQTQSEHPTAEISEIGAEELLDDAGVPIRAQLVADSSGSEDGGASEMVGRYEMLEADKCDDAATYTAQKVRDDSDDNSDDESRLEVNDKLGELRSAGMQNLPNSPSMQDDDSMPWDLKDIASEETMKAAGRTRAEVLNPASRSKARRLISLLSDDSSVPYSLGMSRVESSEQVSEREAEEAPDCDAVTAATKSLQQPELKRDDVVVDEIDGGVEVVETSLVEESEEISPALEIPGVPSGDESDSVNDPSGRIERIIETTKEEQEENKPDPETNDVVPLDIVDTFLDMVTDAEPALPDVLSSSSEPEPIVVINCEEMQDWDDSEAIADLLEGKKPPKEVEIEPQPSTENRAEESVDGPGFLEQFESLEVEENEEEMHNTELVRGLVIDTKAEAIDHPVIKSPLNLLSPTGIAKFFAALDEEYDGKSQKKREQIMAFQRVIAPVVSGKKPTIIESAQIRQAAMRAAIPLEVVDRFLEFAAEDDETALRDILSSHSEAASHANYEDMEDLNEDEAIAAFLTRFGTLHQGGHFPNADIDAVQAFVGQETGSTEEAVEVDATYGFVNKDLVIQNSDPEEDEQEWWKQGQQETKLAAQRGEPRSFESENEELGESRGRSSTGKAMKIEANTSDPDLIDLTEEGPGDQRWVQEEACVVNKKYSASYDVEDTYEWSRKQGIANQGSGWESHKKWLSPKTASALNGPSAIDGVAAVENLNRFTYSKKIFENLQPWKRLYKERTKFHPGFFDVQVNSIYESTTVLTLHDEQDFRPWEHREVQQRFLHEKSFSFSRNWFGDLVKKKGNEKLKMPVCKPKSMEMPIENVPDPGEWTEEWFTQWKTPFGTLSASKSEEYTTDASYTEAGTFTDNGGSYTERGSTTDGASYADGSGTRPRYDESSYSDSGSERSENDEDSWEEAPECGEIINVKLKIGERVTRVHPDFTSSLRRSRWRKKYFPRGTFPY